MATGKILNPNEQKTVYTNSNTAGDTSTEITVDSVDGFRYADLYLKATSGSNNYRHVFTIPIRKNTAVHLTLWSADDSSNEYLHRYAPYFETDTRYKVLNSKRYCITSSGAVYTTNQVGVEKIVVHN